MRNSKLTKDLTAEAQKVAEGQLENPILVASARAGWEANRALWEFTGATGGQSQTPWDDLPKTVKADLVQDAFSCLNGCGPEQIYNRYDHGGVLWDAAEAQEQLQYVLFVQTAATMFRATMALAQGAAQAQQPEGPVQ